ncbi:hypothetical protein ACFL7M_19335 [Thermodesulfobacteriota bacterium]
MKKDRGRTWWILVLFFAIVVVIVAGYYVGIERDPDQTDIERGEKKTPLKRDEVTKEVSEEVPPGEVFKEVSKEVSRIKKEIFRTSEHEKTASHFQEDPCKLIEDLMLDFFNYLNTKSYVQRIEEGLDTYDLFKLLIEKLSSQPPIPAGEGLDKEIIIRNIFFFFRILDRKNIRLIKVVMENESDTLEMNLEMLYKWLILGDKCPDPEGIRPSLDLTYLYAGYFLNTVGGRSYLLRRPSGVRLLIRYYSILIMHEADKKGKNHYGIDIFPEIDTLLKEISIYPYLRFQGDYIDQLTKIQEYYLEKR